VIAGLAGLAGCAQGGVDELGWHVQTQPVRAQEQPVAGVKIQSRDVGRPAVEPTDHAFRQVLHDVGVGDQVLVGVILGEPDGREGWLAQQMAPYRVCDEGHGTHRVDYSRTGIATYR
jgi:hypothetical protein